MVKVARWWFRIAQRWSVGGLKVVCGWLDGGSGMAR
jgi:hypothetical protein